MTFLIPLILRTGIPARFAKAAAWLLTAILALAIVVVCILTIRHVARSHNETIATTAVEAHDKDLSLEAYNMYVTAAAKADANQAIQDQINAANDKELTHEASKGDGAAVGPGVSSVLGRMRDQQAAGRR